MKGRRTPTEKISRLAARYDAATSTPLQRLIGSLRARLQLRHIAQGQTIRTAIRRPCDGGAPRTAHSRRKRNPGRYRRQRAHQARLRQVTLRSSTCLQNGTSSLPVGKEGGR